VAVASGCAVGPAYTVPVVPLIPQAYKEIGQWKSAQPADTSMRGAWWEMFGDADLNALEAQLTVSSQTLKAAQAQYLQARALVRSAHAAQLPQVGGSGSMVASDVSVNKPLRSKTAETRSTDLTLRADVSYELDVWGRVAKTVEASVATAQASAADVESVRLSLHAELALDYFQLRGLDAEKRILDATVASFERALELTQNRYRGGLVSGVDVAQAETQLETIRAQALDIQVRRAQLEHAIAALIGKPAASFAVPAAPLELAPPGIPVGLPADVLERRPDIAGAERRVAAANAQVGFTAAAFYPVLALTGNTGFESAALGDWLKLASHFWSIAPTAVITIFDGGKRKAASAQAQAGYERAVALYQDVVLTAFREVEDQLATLRILAEEARTQEAAVAAAQRLLILANNRYKGGVTTYLEVATAQNAALANQRTAVNILSRRLTSSVLLVKALGGGWTGSSQQ
jgi:NodT family efflux transporter outer membrane factor (OMF) lipoprotein